LCEELKQEPIEYSQIIDKNIEVQNKTLALIRTIFFVENQFQKRFVQKLKFELSPGQVSQYKKLMETLKARNVTFKSQVLLSQKHFSELFDFSNPIAKLKRPFHSENKKSILNFLRRGSRIGSKLKTGSSSNLEEPVNPMGTYEWNRVASNSTGRHNSMQIKRDAIDSHRISWNGKKPKVNVAVLIEKQINPKEFQQKRSNIRVRTKDSSLKNLSKSKADKDEQVEAKNPFFYRVKDKTRMQPTAAENGGDSPVNKAFLLSRNPEEPNSTLLATENPKKNHDKKSKGRQVLFETLNEISPDNVNESENAKRSYKQSSKNLFPEKQSRTIIDSTPSYLDYPSFLKEVSNDYRLFLTGQIVVQIFLEILAESPESLFEPLSRAYESIEEEVSTHFHSYIYLKHLTGIKHNFLRQLEQQIVIQNSSQNQLSSKENQTDNPISPASNFHQKKSEMLMELNLANIRSIAKINSLHSVIVQACDCAQNLISMNKLDAQMVLIERLTTEKKLLTEKDISTQKIKELEQQLDLNSCDPLFNFSKFLRQKAQSMDPRKLEIIEYLAQNIIVLKNFSSRNKYSLLNSQGEFDFVECTNHVFDRLMSLIKTLLDIFKLKFNLIQSFLFSLDRLLNNRQRNISVKHREKLILNIEKYSTTEQVVNNRARREKFQTIIKQLHHQNSGLGSANEMPGGRDSKENGESVGQRFLRNTNQDNTLVRSHFETILREHSLNKSLNISKGRERLDVAMEKVEKSAVMMNKEMSFNFQMLQRLKHSKLIRPNKDPPEKNSAD